MALGPVLQIVMAIAIVIILFVIAFMIFNMELAASIRSAGKLTSSTPIFTGIKDLYKSNNETYNTTNKFDISYIDIAPSINQASGAEMSYNFWLYLDNANYPPPRNDVIVAPDSGLTTDDLILFLHGDRKAYNFKTICKTQDKDDIMIKCPLVKLQRSLDVLVVEFNTSNSVEAVHEASRNTCNENSKDWNLVNSYKLGISGLRDNGTNNYNKRWFMVTIIIQDTSPNDPVPLRNKVRCRILVNGITEMDRYVDGGLNYTTPSLLKRNNGNFYVAPLCNFGNNKNTKQPSGEREVCMADLKYFNYALGPEEVKGMYDAGFTKQYAASIGSTDTSFVDSVSSAGESKQFISF
jgi:hypothetical protein